MRGRFYLVVALLLAGIGIFALINLSGGGGGSRTVVFPDGSEVKVLGAVRSGTSFSSDSPWQGALRRILPPGWRRVLPPVTTIICGSGNTNHLVVFFGVASPMPWSWLVAVDDEGFRYPMSGGSCSTGMGAQAMHGVTFNAFPRRQNSFRLDFLDSSYKVIAQARIENPLPLPPPEFSWRSQPMPVTQTNGELALTLVSAKEQTNAWGSYLNPKWQTQASDPRWKNTQVGYVRTMDPTGNEGGFLSRKEKVWQLKATYHRARWESFDAAERMSVTNLAVPAPGEIIPIDLAQECAGVRVTVEGLYGAGTLYITNGIQRAMTTDYQGGWGTTSSGNITVESFGGKQPFLLMEVAGLGDHDELRLRLTDDQGRPVKHEDQGSYHYRSGSKARIYKPSIEVTNEVQSLSLEIVVSRAKEFVFYINPADIQPPQPKQP